MITEEQVKVRVALMRAIIDSTDQPQLDEVARRINDDKKAAAPYTRDTLFMECVRASWVIRRGNIQNKIDTEKKQKQERLF